MNEKAVQYIDGFKLEMKKTFDFSFLKNYGKVFKLYQQQTGCFCFGISNGQKKYFIKFAGAQPINSPGPVSDDIARLKISTIKYKEMAHPLLINLVESKEIDSGYMNVYDWEDGESFGDQNPHLNEKFNALPTNEKLHIFNEVLRFHEYASECGYIAIDFNDNSTLYNFETGKVTVCDIDFYAKYSYIIGLGASLGDPHFMATEEFRIGGVSNDATNVFRMGAAAFVMLAGGNRSPEAWSFGSDSYAVAKKAVSDEREDRQQSVKRLREEWNAAVK